MAVYAIGDVQGCYKPLRKLLDLVRFNPAKDQLWLVGDIVNRGPQSLEVLRYVKGLGNSARMVLGNHDLNLLAIAYTDREPRRRDTLSPILRAKDREELLYWLRHRPLLHHNRKLGYTMVHAGLPPQWSLRLARKNARRVEKALQGKHYKEFLRNMYGDQPDRWSKSLRGWERLRYSTNALTRIRYCGPRGQLDFEAKGAPGSQPTGCVPWFDAPGRKSKKINLVFGHWATLGTMLRPGLNALDSGCVWGQHLRALRLDQPDRLVVSRCPG